MKKKQFTILLIIVILFSVGIVSLFFCSRIVAEKTYKTHVTVADRVGFNLDADSKNMYFGTVNPGGSISKTVNITNNYHKPVRTMYKKSGDLALWISLPPEKIIEPGEIYSAGFTVSAPLNAQYGNLTGELKILLLKT